MPGPGLDVTQICCDRSWRADGDVFCQRLPVNGAGKKEGKICLFAQKNNNCSSVRVTLRCGLLFAPSVTTGQSQWAVKGSLTNDVTRGGDGTLFQGLRQHNATSLAALWLLSARAEQRWRCSLSWEKKLSFCLAFRSNTTTSRARSLTFCPPPAVQRGFCSPEFASHPNIYMRNHNCTAWEGKHPRRGCKIAALLASVIIPEASQSLAVSGAVFVCLAGQTFEPPRAFAA